MRTDRFFWVVCSLAGVFAAHAAQAFSITSVTLSPGNSVPVGTTLQMTVNITTPGQPAFLYAPTQVHTDATGIHVDIFPGSGALTAIGYLSETATLGTFPPGTYNYEVILHPNPSYGPVGWGVRTNRGSFTVQSGSASAFSSDFNSGLPPGTSVFGSAFVDSTGGVNGSGVLKLTSAMNAQQGSFIINSLDASAPINGFTATFKMLIGGGNGADGLSFNFAPDLPNEIFGEEGAGTGLTVSFDSFDNGGGEAPAIDAKVGGAVVASVPGSGVFRTGDFVDVRIHRDSDGTLDVSVNGTAIFNNLATGSSATSGRFGFGARTGGFNDNHFIDDLTITTGEIGTPTVSIEATQWRTAEPCPTCVVVPGVLTIRRTRGTDGSLTVFLRADGTATTGIDYEALPSSVTIPAGESSVRVNLLPRDDLLVEGPEVARVRLAPASTYLLHGYLDEALIVIHDDEPKAPTARIDIIEPTNGARFPAGRPIELSAIAVNLSNEVYNSEFYANGQLIARAHGDATTRPAISGLPSVHAAVWTNPPAGQHVLTARAELSLNNWVTSPPVNITIQAPTGPVVRLETLPAQNAQSPEFCPPNADCAYGSFVVRRSGPTDTELRVYLSYSGTATRGVDYPELPSSVVIPAGRDFANVILVPNDDSLVEGPETVVARFTPIPGPTYFEDPSASSATITIIDNDATPPGTVVRIFAEYVAVEHGEVSIPEIYARTAHVRISRTGDLSQNLRVFFSIGGSASYGADYYFAPPFVGNSTPPSSWVVPAGAESVVLYVVAREDNATEGMETVLIQLEHSPMMNPLPSYEIDRAYDHAVVGILDQGEARPEVEIVEPREGDHFRLPTSIDIIVAAFHPTRFIDGADIYAGSQKIGELRSLVRPVPLDGPPFDWFVDRFTWSQPPAGTHSLTARAIDETQSVFATSAPVTVVVEGDGPVDPLVSIQTVSPIAEEDTGLLDRLPRRGVFRISHDGPTTDALHVALFYAGIATPGSDYEPRSAGITIPAGTNSVLLDINAIPDDLPEGIETVHVRLTHYPVAPIPFSRYRIDAAHHSATVFIVDGPETEAGLVITYPPNGAVFDPGQTISIQAVAIDLEGEILRVEFWDGENRIGVSELVIDTTAPPRTPIYHRFEWRGASHGPHVLTARATRANGTALKSVPVAITVRGDPPPSLVRIDATSPIAEETSVPFRRLPLVGVFTVSRTGPTNVPTSVWVHYSGMATPGVDYSQPPIAVTIPAGATSTEIRIEAINDHTAEGIETVIATVSDCPPLPIAAPCFFVPIDRAHDRATIWIREDGITDATITIIQPTNNASFNLGESIFIEAVAIDLDRYIAEVEFFAGDQRIGSSGFQFIMAPPDGTPIEHGFEWRNPPPGTHVITARAQRFNGELVISPPVNITVRGEPPGDRELHVVGVYSGTAADGGTSRNHERGDAAVHVNRPGKRVTLVLSAYEPVLWHVTFGDATVIERIILAGYYRQSVQGVGPEVQITPATYEGSPGNYLYVGYSLDCPEVYRAFEKIRAMTGLDISSFHGGYQASYPEPRLINAVQDDPRLRANYPVPTPASQLPSLEFQLSFHNRGSGGDVFTRRYTLAGPRDDSSLLPATRVIRDGGTRYYYGLQWHEAFRVDTQTDTEQPFEPPATLPELSWPWGLTYDPQRNRVLLVSFGGEGHLYGYAPNTEQWSLVRSMENLDIESLEYHAADNSLYALTVFGGDCSSPSVVKLNPDGEVQSRFPLNLHGYGLSLGRHNTELVSVGAYLMLLLEPSHPHGGYEDSESRMYLIDPRNGQSWLTYRSRGGNPANQAPYIVITQPADGTVFPPNTAEVEIAAQTTDRDGYVRRVEFFADGRKIGEQTLDFIMPPPPGQPQRFTFAWRDPAPGSHVLTARAFDDDNASALSGAVTIRVGSPDDTRPVVNVSAPDSFAAEPSASAIAVLDTATFRVSRSGPTNAPLAVGYTLYGTAQNGVDYERLAAFVVIPAGRRSAEVTVRPLADNLAEDIESIVFQLMPPPPIALDPAQQYAIGTRDRAGAVLADADPARPRDASCRAVAGGLHITFQTSSGHNYRVEASTDLVNWETVSTATAADDTVHYVETERASFPRRFYRVVPESMPLATD